LSCSIFWRIYGKLILIVLAVLSLIGAGAYGAMASDTDFAPYLPDLIPAAKSFEIVAEEPAEGSFLYAGYNPNGIEAGYISIGEGQGYGGPMNVLVAWSLEGTITDIQVPEHHETKAWYSKLAEEEYFTQFIGGSYGEPLTLNEDIDAVTGATGSSSGVAAGVRAGRQLLSEYLGDPYPIPKEEVDFGLGEILLLVGLGSVVAVRTVPLELGKLRCLADGLCPRLAAQPLPLHPCLRRYRPGISFR